MKERYKMIKFFKGKNTEIRKVCSCWAEGTVNRDVAVIGQVKELLEKEIIFPDNTQGNSEKWLVVMNNENTDIFEFETLECAKEYCRTNLL